MVRSLDGPTAERASRGSSPRGFVVVGVAAVSAGGKRSTLSGGASPATDTPTAGSGGTSPAIATATATTSATGGTDAHDGRGDGR